jgi:hypothetical protein
VFIEARTPWLDSRSVARLNFPASSYLIAPKRRLTMTRLTFLILAIMAVAACAPGTSDGTPKTAVAAPQDATQNIPEEEIEWLFVQNAQGVVLEDDTLRLEGVSPTTVFFSDRPERQAGLGSTAQFITFWTDGGGSDNFAKDAPNATLSVVTETTTDDLVVELLNPRFDGDDLLYDVNVIAGRTSLSGGPASLFIDVIGMPLTPVSVAGVARRTTRRTVRRMRY